MESQPPRNFREVGVDAYTNQDGPSRFKLVDGERDYPPVAKWRMGLTALSQRYNLYFVAHGEHIYVTVPENVRQTIPGIPNLKISLPRSEASYRVPGYISTADTESSSHCMNHLIVGNLGDLEIVLVACDDGDVLAYYTHLIHQEVTEFRPTVTESAFDSLLTPMFHENVGISAWGLAVHQKSRLLAISSNASAVTVFAFSLDNPGRPMQRSTRDLAGPFVAELLVSPTRQLFDLVENPPISAREGRMTGYKRVFNLAARSSNIPAVTFASGLDGEAQMVLAVDILGNLWQLDLWKGDGYGHTPPLKRIYQQAEDEHSPRSWGVLVLPLNTFRVEKQPTKALGVPYLHDTISSRANLESSSKFFDITCSKYDIRDPTLNDAVKLTLESDDENSETLDSISPTLHARSGSAIPPSSISSRIPTRLTEQQFLKEERSKRLPPRVQQSEMDDFKMLLSLLIPDELAKKLKKQKMPPVHGIVRERSPYLLPDGSAILRTYTYDIELIPPTKATPPTICQEVFAQRTRMLPINVALLDRLDLVTCIPELSLVLATSQAGDVAVLTLTKVNDGLPGCGPVVSFRLDYRLPFARHRPPANLPASPLVGMAVSPVWSGQDGDGEASGGLRRWRMLLHYKDHRILSYEFHRGGDGDLLMV